ncbi:MAG: cation diffusion facilitator family transporter, partial [Planctomycetaceae bacterium]
MSQHESESLGERAAQLGVLVNAALVAVKLVAGVVGNSYALVADAVESTADIFSSLVVLGGLRLARREADEDFPFGYGRAETLAAAVVALMLIGTAIGIAVEAVREISTPQHAPAAWTLVVLVLVMVVKWAIARHVA